MKNADRNDIQKARKYCFASESIKPKALTEHGQVERRVTEDMYAVAAMRRYSRTM